MLLLLIFLSLDCPPFIYPIQRNENFLSYNMIKLLTFILQWYPNCPLKKTRNSTIVFAHSPNWSFLLSYQPQVPWYSDHYYALKPTCFPTSILLSQQNTASDVLTLNTSPEVWQCIPGQLQKCLNQQSKF